MIYAMCYKIRIGDYNLTLLDSVEIVKNVELLSDTAIITIPAQHNNRTINIEDKIQVGDAVSVKLGYNDQLHEEFTGYVNRIGTDDGNITLECTDAFYLFKVPVQNKEYKNVRLIDLLRDVARQVDPNIGISCDYDMLYDKFTIFKANGDDVLKKVQDDTKANIYFEGNVLHVHAPYREVAEAEPVIFDFTRNIESSDLKYVKLEDRKIEVEVVVNGKDGIDKKFTYGVTGGERRTIKGTSTDDAAMKALAESEYNRSAYDGYDGSFTGWLIPFVAPTYRVSLKDKDYPYKDGVYYVVATEVSFGSDGGKRKITLGRKLR